MTSRHRIENTLDAIKKRLDEATPRKLLFLNGGLFLGTP
jgi:hypothetical protein